MLDGDASDFYYKSVIGRDLGFETIVALIRENFKGEERRNMYQSQWNSTSL
jgi:hypothetical protein